jgi:hypothetical protein
LSEVLWRGDIFETLAIARRAFEGCMVWYGHWGDNATSKFVASLYRKGRKVFAKARREYSLAVLCGITSRSLRFRKRPPDIQML